MQELLEKRNFEKKLVNNNMRVFVSVSPLYLEGLIVVVVIVICKQEELLVRYVNKLKFVKQASATRFTMTR